jgi:hypothetical protein
MLEIGFDGAAFLRVGEVDVGAGGGCAVGIGNDAVRADFRSASQDPNKS